MSSIKGKTLGSKAHSPLGNPAYCHQEYNGAQRHDNTSYIWGRYDMITNNTIHM